MLAALICREYGWTHDEFWSQPQTFIETIMEMLNAEAEAQNKKQEKKPPNRR